MRISWRGSFLFTNRAVCGFGNCLVPIWGGHNGRARDGYGRVWVGYGRFVWQGSGWGYGRI